MRRIGVQFSQPGMVLSQPVFDSYGNMVMSQGTRLTFDNSSTLSQMGSGEIFIQDRRVDDVPVTSIMPARLEGEATRQMRGLIDETRKIITGGGRFATISNIEKVMFSMVSHLFPAYFGEVHAAGCLSLKDYNFLHPVQVGSLSIVMARTLGLKDDEMQKIGVAALISNIGYEALPAQTAAIALRHLDARTDVALIFTDVVMPEMNGRKLADEALKRRPDVKILFTSGYTANAIVHNGVLDAGVSLIGKPYTIEALARKIREVLAG